MYRPLQRRGGDEERAEREDAIAWVRVFRHRIERIGNVRLRLDCCVGARQAHARHQVDNRQSTRGLHLEPTDKPLRHIRRERRDDTGHVLVVERAEYREIASVRRMRDEPSRQHLCGLRIVGDIDDEVRGAGLGEALQARGHTCGTNARGQRGRSDAEALAQSIQSRNRRSGVGAMAC